MIAGCGGRPTNTATPPASAPPDVIAEVIAAASMDTDPNPTGCTPAAIADNFGGCPLNAFAVHIGRTVELQDTFAQPHHLFITQETAPGFDGVTGIVQHYQKTNPSTGKMEPGDDGMGYWCKGDPTAELYFGLTHLPADRAQHKASGWYATHQRIKCGSIVGTADVAGQGYLIFADLPGDTGAVTFNGCWQANVLTWNQLPCSGPGSTGWRTVMGRKNGKPFTLQMEGPAVLGKGALSAGEGWTTDSNGDLLAVLVIDDGTGIDKTDARLSMHQVNVIN